MMERDDADEVQTISVGASGVLENTGNVEMWFHGENYTLAFFTTGYMLLYAETHPIPNTDTDK